MLRLFVSIVVFSFSSYTNADCSFEQSEALYKIEEAKNDAARNFLEDRSVIYVVAKSLVPTRPQFEKRDKLTGCLLEAFWEKQVVLWTGSDVVGLCKDKKKAVEKATTYASVYNKHLIELLKNSGHKCFEYGK